MQVRTLLQRLHRLLQALQAPLVAGGLHEGGRGDWKARVLLQDVHLCRKADHVPEISTTESREGLARQNGITECEILDHNVT